MIQGQLLEEQEAAIFLPASLFKAVGVQTSTTNIGIVFGLYENATLFPVGGDVDNSQTIQTEVYSRVLAATVGQSITVENLQPEESVIVTFRLMNKQGTVSLHTIYTHWLS